MVLTSFSVGRGIALHDSDAVPHRRSQSDLKIVLARLDFQGPLIANYGMALSDVHWSPSQLDCPSSCVLEHWSSWNSFSQFECKCNRRGQGTPLIVWVKKKCRLKLKLQFCCEIDLEGPTASLRQNHSLTATILTQMCRCLIDTSFTMSVELPRKLSDVMFFINKPAKFKKN